MSTHALLCISDGRLRSLFSLLFADSEAQVTTCHEGSEFQRALGMRFYDLCALTLDVAVDMAGFVKAVRSLSPDTRILLIANREDVEQIIPLFQLGVSEVLLQPINPKKAISAIHKMIASRQVDTRTETVGGAADKGSRSPFGSTCRPQHITARSPGMNVVVNQLLHAREEPLGIILRGEPGTEFELIAREYQSICGDPSGYVYVFGHSEITSEGLATAASLDRLNDGIPRTFLVKDLELLPTMQQGQLLDFLRLAKRRRDRDRPLRFVFTVAECDDVGRSLDLPFVEELLYVVTTVVKVPPLRDRKEDIEPLARKLLLDLTAIHPACRARSIKAGVTEWLSGRLWRGNHDEFCAYMRDAIMDCPSREVTLAYLTAREASFAGRPAGDILPPPLTTTTSMNTMVATTVPAKTTASPFGERAGKLTAKELLATLR